jgi:hypothetical protein
MAQLVSVLRPTQRGSQVVSIANSLRVEPGKSVVIVTGLGGRGVRQQPQRGRMTTPRLIKLRTNQAFQQLPQGGDLLVNGYHLEQLLFGVWIER